MRGPPDAAVNMSNKAFKNGDLIRGSSNVLRGGLNALHIAVSDSENGDDLEVEMTDSQGDLRGSVKGGGFDEDVVVSARSIIWYSFHVSSAGAYNTTQSHFVTLKVVSLFETREELKAAIDNCSPTSKTECEAVQQTYGWPMNDWKFADSLDTMWELFYGNTDFNEDISGWDVSRVTRSMWRMFRDATSFNQDISGWDVSNVESLSVMFMGATSFNQDLSGWDVTSATSLAHMFRDATAFNSDISNWDVSNIVRMDQMFEGATSFNSDISSWVVSKVEQMDRMFDGATSFNQDISLWNVSSALDMKYMFRDASSFNQDLCLWSDEFPLDQVTDMFKDSGCTYENDPTGVGGYACKGYPCTVSDGIQRQ